MFKSRGRSVDANAGWSSRPSCLTDLLDRHMAVRMGAQTAKECGSRISRGLRARKLANYIGTVDE